jgi:hypothetical protein
VRLTVVEREGLPEYTVVTFLITIPIESWLLISIVLICRKLMILLRIPNMVLASQRRDSRTEVTQKVY